MDAEKAFLSLMEQRRTHGAVVGQGAASLGDLLQIEVGRIPQGRRIGRHNPIGHTAGHHQPFARLTRPVAKVA